MSMIGRALCVSKPFSRRAEMESSLDIHVWMGVLYLTLLTFNGAFIDAATLAEASFNDPKCEGGGVVCPADSLLFTCNITDSIGTRATVAFSFGEMGTISLIGLTNNNVTEGVVPDGIHIQSYNVTGTSPYDYILILSITNASLLNGGNVTCDSSIGVTDMARCPITGDPGPPLNLTHDMSANTVSSAVIRWDSPSTTGGGGDGISITGYRIMSSDNGLNLNETVNDTTYTITGVEYNTNYSVEVTATNSCGQESGPASVVVNIEARVPPPPTVLPPELYCDVPQDGRPVIIRWMYGTEMKGVVYPGTVGVSVVLNPGGIACSGVTAEDTSCVINITEDGVYSITVTLTNEIDSAQAMRIFNSSVFTVDRVNATSINVTLSPFCHPNTTYTAEVFFGVIQQNSNDTCPPEQNKTAAIVPGESKILSVDTTALVLEDDQEYCYTNVSLTGDATTMPSPTPTPIATSSPDPDPDSSIVIIVVIVIVVVVVIILVIVIAVGVYCLCRKKAAIHDDQEMKNLSPSSGTTSPTLKESSALPTEFTPSPLYTKPSSSPPPAEPSDQGPMYQGPGSITRTPHPETGEIYTDVKLEKKKKKKEQKTSEETGPVYQDPGTIEHQEAPGGDVYAVSQKKGKRAKKEKGKEESAALYSKPDREGQKAKSQGLTYAQPDVSPSSQPPPPSEGSTYADLQYPPSDDA